MGGGGRRQNSTYIPRSPKLPNSTFILVPKKLRIPTLPPQETRHHDETSKYRKQCTDAVELLREDLEDDEGEGELGERGAEVGALKGALRGADLDELFLRQDDAACSVLSESVAGTRVMLL